MIKPRSIAFSALLKTGAHAVFIFISLFCLVVIVGILLIKQEEAPDINHVTAQTIVISNVVNRASVTYKDSGGISYGPTLSNQTTVTVINNPPQIIIVTASPASGNAPLFVAFTINATDADGSIQSYSWDFGDGGASSSQNPSHTYQNTGTYSATVTVTDNDGAINQNSASIIASTPQPPAAQDATPPTIPIGITANIAHDSIFLSWSASTDSSGVSGYEIYRDNKKITAISSPQYNDTNIKPNFTYSYQIAAYDIYGYTSQKSGSASFTTPPVPAFFPIPTQNFQLPPITNFQIENADYSNGKVALSWQNPPASTDWVKTYIRRKTGSYPNSPKDPESSLFYSGSASNLTDYGLQAGNAYYYAAFTLDENDNYSERAILIVNTPSTTIRATPLPPNIQDTPTSAPLSYSKPPLERHPVFTERLSLGSRGDEVEELQIILAKDPDVYPEGEVTGRFDSKTENAVKRFQEKYRITTSETGYGLIGPKTREKLNEIYKNQLLENTTSSDKTKQPKSIVANSKDIINSITKAITSLFGKLISLLF